MGIGMVLGFGYVMNIKGVRERFHVNTQHSHVWTVLEAALLVLCNIQLDLPAVSLFLNLFSLVCACKMAVFNLAGFGVLLAGIASNHVYEGASS